MATNLNLLLIEDDAVDQRAFLRYVARNQLSYQCQTASTVQDALKIIRQSQFDIIISDYQLTDGTAFDILDVASCPVIVITGMGNENIAVQLMKTGAADYIVKDTERQYLTMITIVVETVLRHHEAIHLAEAQSRILAATEERQRIARELHDSVSQTLFSINTISASLPQLSDEQPAALPQVYQQLYTLSQSALAEMRALLAELRSGTLENADLGELIRIFVESRQAHTTSHLMFQDIGTGDLSPQIQFALYRITQEAVNNAIRHANAKTIGIVLERNTNSIRLTVSDDGIGFDINAIPATHHGLKILAERSAEIGANLTIESDSHNGTSVIVEIGKK